jgi:hypothetical protein
MSITVRKLAAAGGLAIALSGAFTGFAQAQSAGGGGGGGGGAGGAAEAVITHAIAVPNPTPPRRGRGGGGEAGAPGACQYSPLYGAMVCDRRR